MVQTSGGGGKEWPYTKAEHPNFTRSSGKKIRAPPNAILRMLQEMRLNAGSHVRWVWGGVCGNARESAPGVFPGSAQGVCLGSARGVCPGSAPGVCPGIFLLYFIFPIMKENELTKIFGHSPGTLPGHSPGTLPGTPRAHSPGTRKKSSGTRKKSSGTRTKSSGTRKKSSGTREKIPGVI